MSCSCASRAGAWPASTGASRLSPRAAEWRRRRSRRWSCGRSRSAMRRWPPTSRSASWSTTPTAPTQSSPRRAGCWRLAACSWSRSRTSTARAGSRRPGSDDGAGRSRGAAASSISTRSPARSSRRRSPATGSTCGPWPRTTPRGSSARRFNGYCPDDRSGRGRGGLFRLERHSLPSPPRPRPHSTGATARWCASRGRCSTRSPRSGCLATCCWSWRGRPDAILLPMSEPSYRLDDVGDRRVLTVEGREYSTRYSERVVRMLIERKGVHRAPLYFDFKETRGRHFLGPLFRYLRARRAQDLAVLEVGCSFGHVTEYLAEQPEIATIHAFDTDPAFVAITRAKVEELGLKTVRSVARLSNEETWRLPWADGAFDVVLAVGVVEHLPARHRRAQVDEFHRV